MALACSEQIPDQKISVRLDLAYFTFGKLLMLYKRTKTFAQLRSTELEDYLPVMEDTSF